MTVADTGDRRALRSCGVSRTEVEDLLFEEASLLDDWRMDDWLKLWHVQCSYVIPTNDNPDADPDHDLVYANHDRRLLEGLVNRLKSTHAHREYPWSKTRHIVSNVQVLGMDDEGLIHARAVFTVWRFRHQDADSFVGRYDLRLALSEDGSLLFREKRVILDAWTLAPYGAISIVL